MAGDEPKYGRQRAETRQAKGRNTAGDGGKKPGDEWKHGRRRQAMEELRQATGRKTAGEGQKHGRRWGKHGTRRRKHGTQRQKKAGR